jgi:hypothetical protein
MNYHDIILLQTLFKVTSASAKRIQNCNRQRTPGMRATPTFRLISLSLAKFGRLKCPQGTQIAGNVDVTLKKYEILVSVVSTLILRASLVSVARPLFESMFQCRLILLILALFRHVLES